MPDPIVRTDYLAPAARMGATIQQTFGNVGEQASNIYNFHVLMRDAGKTKEELMRGFKETYGGEDPTESPHVQNLEKYFSAHPKLTGPQIAEVVYGYKDMIDGDRAVNDTWIQQHPDENFPGTLTPRPGMKPAEYIARARALSVDKGKAIDAGTKKKNLEEARKFIADKKGKWTYEHLVNELMDHEGYMQHPEIIEIAKQMRESEKEQRMRNQKDTHGELTPKDKFVFREKLFKDLEDRTYKVKGDFLSKERTATEDELSVRKKALRANPKIISREELENELDKIINEKGTLSTIGKYNRFKAQRTQ